MRIKISTRFTPFSHQAGIRCLIPGTTWEAQVFPALVQFTDLAGEGIYTLPTSHQGPVEGFTVQQDLEKKQIRIFGRARNGYFCSFIQRREKKLLFDDQELPIKLSLIPPPESKERLFLGIHKKQQWERMMERLNPCELWPFWLYLAQRTPLVTLEKMGSYCLLAACEHASKVDRIRLWRLVFLGCFQGILSPRLADENHLGLFPETQISPRHSPIGLLHEGSRLIRSLFFAEQEELIHLLPSLPPQCHAGRFLNLRTTTGDCFDLEWSKKILKKVVIHPASTHTLFLKTQKDIRHFRLRISLKDRGRKVVRDQPIYCEEGQRLFLDRFS